MASSSIFGTITNTAPQLSWNLFDDIAALFHYDFMVHAFEAGTIVAMVAGAIGYFVVLRSSSFAAHALSHIGFAGATGAVVLAINPIFGLLAFTLGSGVAIGALGNRLRGRDVTIDVNCVFEGRVTLGDGVRIGPNCVLRNVSLGAGTQVQAFSQLDEAEVGANCRIGPYARLRPGANLAEDVHIGNFVEVKASRIGVGSKANHLSYIGDSEVGARVNIGAGTITCNYDGVSKHRTVIEDECFIGSDATLVAPVTIARGSYIGAGSTISKNTPAGQLTVARAKQVSVPAWKPPKKKG